jgi:hypothetical protein
LAHREALPVAPHVLLGSVQNRTGGHRWCIFFAEMKAITLMRYIRKALEDETFVKAA